MKIAPICTGGKNKTKLVGAGDKYLTQKFNRIKTTRIVTLEPRKPNCRRSLSKKHTHKQNKNSSPMEP